MSCAVAGALCMEHQWCRMSAIHTMTESSNLHIETRRRKPASCVCKCVSAKSLGCRIALTRSRFRSVLHHTVPPARVRFAPHRHHIAGPQLKLCFECVSVNQRMTHNASAVATPQSRAQQHIPPATATRTPGDARDERAGYCSSKLPLRDGAARSRNIRERQTHCSTFSGLRHEARDAHKDGLCGSFCHGLSWSMCARWVPCRLSTTAPKPTYGGLTRPTGATSK